MVYDEIVRSDAEIEYSGEDVTVVIREMSGNKGNGFYPVICYDYGSGCKRDAIMRIREDGTLEHVRAKGFTDEELEAVKDIVVSKFVATA